MGAFHLDEELYFDDSFHDADVIVTDYTTGCYDGSGDALVYRNGMVEYYNLGHCSCYGPLDDGPNETMTLEVFREQNGSATCSWGDAVGAKFLDLVLHGEVEC